MNPGKAYLQNGKALLDFYRKMKTSSKFNTYSWVVFIVIITIYSQTVFIVENAVLKIWWVKQQPNCITLSYHQENMSVQWIPP